MKFNFQEYMSKIFKFSNEIVGTKMRFEDQNIEQEYTKSNMKDEIKKSIIFYLVFLLVYIISISANLAYNNFHPNRSTWIIIGGYFLIWFFFFS